MPATPRNADCTPALKRGPRTLLIASLAATLLGCGGGGGDPGVSPFPTPSGSSGSAGSASGGGSSVTPADASAQTCAPENPYLADASSAVTLGSLANEKAWLQAYMSEAYLWFSEMQNPSPYDPAYSDTRQVYNSLDNYFQALKTPVLTASGKRRDAFSFTYPTKAWNDLSQGGMVSGYGIEWFLASPTPPRGLRIAYVEPGSPAAAAGLLRGDTLVSADGAAADGAEVDTLNAALYPAASGQSHRFEFLRAGVALSASLVSATITKQPVLTAQVLQSPAGRKVGYLVFNDHIAPAEQPLIDAVRQFSGAAVQDLVLDLRYNGGGFLYLASELAYMVAGPARTSGQVFEQLNYNSKRSADTAASRTPFIDTSCLPDSAFNCTVQNPLPTLNLSRVTVLTSAGTCSASEAIINGLRGVGVEVRLIGDTTCGKPYGFTPRDNCGISYFPIEFQGVNAQGFGDYADGFSPNCAAADDLDHALGSTSEGQLGAALYQLDNNSCQPGGATLQTRRQAQGGRIGAPLLRGPARENRILQRLRR